MYLGYVLLVFITFQIFELISVTKEKVVDLWLNPVLVNEHLCLYFVLYRMEAFRSVRAIAELWDGRMKLEEDRGLVRHRWVARRGVGAPWVAAPRAPRHVGLDT